MCKVITTLRGEFVTPEVVKDAKQKDYNQSVWEQTVERYNKYSDAKFLQVASKEGDYYPFKYYVTYIADGIRFMQEVSYGSCLSNAGFAYGFITNGLKDPEACKKVLEIMPELEGLDKDSFTIMSYDNDGRLANNKKARDYMRHETGDSVNRFYTNNY